MMDGVIIIYPPDNLSRETVNHGYSGRLAEINIPAMNLSVENMRNFLFELLKACDFGEDLNKQSKQKDYEISLKGKK